MPLVGFEPTIPVFKRAKTFHALDRAAAVTGYYVHLPEANKSKCFMYQSISPAVTELIYVKRGMKVTTL
jgi:hypothetical protein